MVRGSLSCLLSIFLIKNMTSFERPVGVMATARKSAWLFVNRYDLGNSRWGLWADDWRGWTREIQMARGRKCSGSRVFFGFWKV